MKTTITLMLAVGALASAQQPRDYELRCRQEAANRLRADRENVTVGIQDSDHGRSRVSWTYRDRNGYCVIDNSMNIAEFREFAGNNGDQRYNERTAPSAPIANVPRVKVNTAGRGNFSGPQTAKVTRGWVDTSVTPTVVSLSGEKNFKITFNGDVTRQNGDREYVMDIRSSDRGDASGRATFRLNKDKNEVEFISIDGRMNGSDFNGSFNR
jgi:hypothetical protein